DMGFHVAIFDPPPGTSPGDHLRVRVKAPSATPVISAESANGDALKDLASVLELVNAARAGAGDTELQRVVVDPVLTAVWTHGPEPGDVDVVEAALRRGL